jgi:LysM repeat protein
MASKRRKGRHSRPSKTNATLTTLAGGASTAFVAGALVTVSHATPALAATTQPVQLTAQYTSDQLKIPLVKTDPSAPSTYTVRAGDTLWGISKTACGTPDDYPSLYGANANAIGSDPDVIVPGQKLVLDCAHAALMADVQPSWWHGTHEAHVTHVIHVEGQADDGPSQGPVVQSYSQPEVQQSSNVNPGDYSGFQACVISRESGGNSQVMNSSGHYGLYQFSESTWEAYGGSASDFGDASVAEQNQVFDNAMAAGGESNWSPYDGC